MSGGCDVPLRGSQRSARRPSGLAHLLPVALAQVPRPEGTVVSFTAEGHGGRTWHLVMAAEGRDLRDGLPHGTTSCAAAKTVDASIALYARNPGRTGADLAWDPQIAAALAPADRTQVLMPALA